MGNFGRMTELQEPNTAENGIDLNDPDAFTTTKVKAAQLGFEPETLDTWRYLDKRAGRTGPAPGSRQPQYWYVAKEPRYLKRNEFLNGGAA